MQYVCNHTFFFNSASLDPGFLHYVMIYCTADCFADQTALDLVCSDELRAILAAYQAKVSAHKMFITVPFF